MRYEPLEISVKDGARWRQRRQRQRPVFAESTHVQDIVLPQDVVDEAFADLPVNAASTSDGRQVLLSQLAAQVGAIDRHCQRLSQVIKHLDCMDAISK